MHKATEEVGFGGLFFLHRFDHLERRADVRQFVDGKKCVYRHGGFEVKEFGNVHDAVAVHMHARVGGVTEHDGHFVDGGLIRHTRLAFGWVASVAACVQKLGNFLLRLAVCPHLKRLFDEYPILTVGTKIAVRVFVVAVLGDMDALALFQRPTLPTRHHFAQMVAVLLGEHKGYAEEHFTHGSILEAECRKGEVLDYLLVEQVDDFACVGHVASKTVGMPRQNRVVLTLLDVLYHLFEMDADVGFFCAFTLLDDGNVFKRYFHALSRIQTILLLVGDTPLLPFVGGGAFAGIQDETQGLDVHLVGFVWPMKRHKCIVEVFGCLHRNTGILARK